jgi:hypothetical protein
MNMNTNSKEYVEWVANVWRLNSERNKRIEQHKKDMEHQVSIAEINSGLYE